MADIAGSTANAGGPAVGVGVYAALAYQIFSASCSSPQTSEINVDKRGDTLFKWVKIAGYQVVLWGGLGAILEKDAGRPAWPPLLGAGLAGGLMWVQYRHALNAGLANAGAQGTES